MLSAAATITATPSHAILGAENTVFDAENVATLYETSTKHNAIAAVTQTTALTTLH